MGLELKPIKSFKRPVPGRVGGLALPGLWVRACARTWCLLKHYRNMFFPASPVPSRWSKVKPKQTMCCCRGHFGFVLGLACAALGHLEPALGLPWEYLGPVSGNLYPVLGLAWAILGLSWALIGQDPEKELKQPRKKH